VNVIIVYATKHGSTQGVAGAVADALRERGAQVTLRPARAVREPVAGYGLVVLGAALYSGRWHRDAHRFLKRHRRELAGVPVAVFGMGPRSDTEDAWQRSRAQLDRALGKHRWLSPAAVTVFGGVDPPGRRNHPQRDLRNWQTIRVWAAQACRRRSFARSRRRPTPAATGAGGTACRLEPSATLAKSCRRG